MQYIILFIAAYAEFPLSFGSSCVITLFRYGIAVYIARTIRGRHQKSRVALIYVIMIIICAGGVTLRYIVECGDNFSRSFSMINVVAFLIIIPIYSTLCYFVFEAVETRKPIR